MIQEHARGSASTREAQAGDSARPANTQGKGDAWKSENHSSSSCGVWGKAAFNEDAQRSDSSPSTQAVEESAETMRSGPVTVPHSISYPSGTAGAGSQAWMGPLSASLPSDECAEALDEPFPYWISGYASRQRCLLACTERRGEAQEAGVPGTTLTPVTLSPTVVTLHFKANQAFL